MEEFEEINANNVEEMKTLVEKYLRSEKKAKVTIEFDGRIEYLVLTFDDGVKAYFSDGEYGDLPLWHFKKRRGS